MSECRSGPWETQMDAIGQLTVWSHEHYPIATIVNGDSAEANARLIAAAPDTEAQRNELLEALEGLNSSWAEELCFCVATWFHKGHMEKCKKAIDAIAKAKGE